MKNATEPTKPTLKTETKYLKHDFTPDEKQALGMELARKYSEVAKIELELDQVKQQFKAKSSEVEARIQGLSANLVTGFEMRNKVCVVVLVPDEKKKRFYLEDVYQIADQEGWLSELEPALIEDMTPADFQQELLEAESKFEKREEITLFQPTDRDAGVLVVGAFNNRWFSALRVHVGKHQIEERLDSEQKSFKHRKDAVTQAGKRALEWFEEVMPKDAPGFKDPILQAVAAHMERVE